MKKEIKYILSLFLTWRISLFFIAWISIFFITKNSAYRSAWLFDIENYNLINIWYRWDSAHYDFIATHGYEWVNSVVFFPLYPFLMRIFSYFIPFEYPTMIAGFLISNFAIIIALFYFYKLIKLDYSDQISRRALLYLLIFPMSIFFASIYTESLFLMLTLASFYYVRKNNYKASAMAVFLACLTRFAGIFVFIAILVEYLYQNNYRIKALRAKNAFYIYLSSLGLISYMFFLNLKYQNPFLFISAQSHWGRNFVPIWNVLFDSIIYIFINLNMFFTLAYFNNLIELAYFIIFAIISVYVWGKMRKSYAIYMIISIVIPLLSGSVASLNRYVLVLFPAFIILAIIGQNKLHHVIISITFTIFLIYHTIMFANLYWVG
ncbi:hypothetical protein K0B03_00790 [Patescibacteria group bacterium]|nr:hypothetical protein [Patescibacteria group bacterium]